MSESAVTPSAPPQACSSTDAAVAVGGAAASNGAASTLSPGRPAAASTSSFMRERLQAFSAASSSPSPPAAAAVSPAAGPLPVAKGTVAAKKAAFATTTTTTATINHVAGHDASSAAAGATVPASAAASTSDAATAVAPKTVTAVVAQLTKPAAAAAARPTHVRRNSAPKGSVRSLLSFWRGQEGEPAGGAIGGGASALAGPNSKFASSLEREREQREQDARVAAQRKQIRMDADAKAAQHQQQLAAAGAQANAAATPVNANHVAVGAMSITVTADPRAATDIAAKQQQQQQQQQSPPSDSPVAAVPAGASPSPSLSPSMSPSSLLSPAPSTLSPSSPPEEGESAGGNDCTVATSDGREQSNASSFLSPPIAVNAAAPTDGADTGAEGTMQLPAAPSLPPAAPLFATGAAPGLARCITDFGMDGSIDSAHQQQQQQYDSTVAAAVSVDSYRSSRAGSTSVAPPLQREVTDYNATVQPSCVAADHGHSGVGAVPAQVPHSHGGAVSFAAMPPPLRREVTDPLLNETDAWSAEEHDSALKEQQQPQQPLQQQPSHAPSQLQLHIQAPPPLSRLVTDPCDSDGQGQSLPEHSSLAAIEAGDGADAQGAGSRRVSLSQDPASAAARAALFPSQHQQGQHAGGVPQSSPVLLTRLQTDVVGMNASPLCTPLPRSDLGHAAFAPPPAAAIAASAPLPLLTRLATDPSQQTEDPCIHPGQQHLAVHPPPPQPHVTPAPLLTRVLTELDMQQMADEDEAARFHQQQLQQQQQGQEHEHRSRHGSIAGAPAPLMTRVQTEMHMHAHESEEVGADGGAGAPLMPAPMPLMCRVHTEIDMAARQSEEDQEAEVHAAQPAAPAQARQGPPTFLLTRQTTDVRRASASASASGSRSRSRSLSAQSRSVSPARHPAASDDAAGEGECDSDAETEAGDDEAAEPNWAEEEQEAADAVGAELALPPGTRGARGSVVAGMVGSPLSVSTSGSGSYSNLSVLDPSTPSEFGSCDAPSTPVSSSGRRTPAAADSQGMPVPVPPTTPLSVVQALQSPLPVPPSPSFKVDGAAAGASGAATNGTTQSTPADGSVGAGAGESQPEDPAAAAAAAATMASFRSKVEGELLSTEETYVSSLGLLVTQFIHPLKTNQDALGITSGQIGLIFSNVELLYNFHCIFLQDLAQAVRESRRAAAEAAEAQESGVVVSSSATAAAAAAAAVASSAAPGSHVRSGSMSGKGAPRLVSEVILKCADFLRMYTGYLAGYSVALDTIAGLRSNGKFTAFLLQQRAAAAAAAAAAGGKPSGSGLDVMSYLIMPVQRIPRYLLLLKELLRYTPRGHPELLALQDAYTKVQRIARHINEQQRSIENMSVLLSIQNSIESSSLAELGQLMQPHRRLVRSGVLHKLTSGLISKSHVRRVYLCNDILLWCETAASPDAGTTPGGGNNAAMAQEKFRGFVELDSATVREYFEKKGKTGFRLSTPRSKKEVVFVCRSSEEKQAWLGDIRAAQASVAEAAEEARKRRMDSRVKNAVGAASSAHAHAAAAARLSVPNMTTTAAEAAGGARHTREGSASVIGMSGEDLLGLQAAASNGGSSSPLPGDSSALHGFVSNRLRELPVTVRARPASMATVSPRAAAAAAAGGGVAGGVGAGALAAMATRNTLRSGPVGLSAAPHQLGAVAAALAPSPSSSQQQEQASGGSSSTAARAEPQVETMSIEEWTVCEEMAAGRRTRARPSSF